MMKIEQLKLDRQTRSLQNMMWKQESYSTTNTELRAFMNDYISMLGKNSMMKSENYVTYTASTTGSNKDAVTVKSTAEAFGSSYSVDSVYQLAEAAKAQSGKAVSGGKGLAESNGTALKDLAFANTLYLDSEGKISFEINGESFSFTGEDSLQKVMNTINASDAGVRMSYSRLTDRISIESKETGKDGAVSIRNISGNAFGEVSAFDIEERTYRNGKDAVLSVNGIVIERDSNSFNVDGLSITLNETFNEEAIKHNEATDKYTSDATAATDGAVRVNMTRDVSAAVDKIKQFVEGFNTLVSKLNDMVYSKKSTKERGYTPLTEEEKEGMTDEQIEKWETIAKKGLMYNDSGLKGLISGLRSALYESVEGIGLSPADIGLRTGDWDGYGTIKLDEDALKSALEKNPDGVMGIFTNISNSADKTTAAKENGLLYRINNLMNDYVKANERDTLYELERTMYQTSEKISDMEEKMLELEERYYMKYAALEQAMAGMSSQTNYLSTLLGSLK
jgi:flagellar hook-associated protein 2